MRCRKLRAAVAGAALVVGIVGTAGTADAAPTYPKLIELPGGWLAEGIAVGRGGEIFAGSRANGAVYRADLRTGEGSVVVPGTTGAVAVGLKLDDRSNLLYVAGGPTGKVTVYDAATGATVVSLQVAAPAASFVNDVVITRDAAWFTDSFASRLYRVPIGPGGRPGSTFTTLPLTGDLVNVPNAFNLNGIVATPDGRSLVAVQMATGKLFRIDQQTGVTDEIDLGGENVVNGDGMILRGRTLYVVRNFDNRVDRVELAPDLRSGSVTGSFTDPAFDTPATIAAFGSRLYVVNGRFTTPVTPTTPYQIVQLD